MIKPIEESRVCVIDSGCFVPLADMFGKVAKRTSYNSAWEQESATIDRCVIGDGFQNFQRVDDYINPEFFDSVVCGAFWIWATVNSSVTCAA